MKKYLILATLIGALSFSLVACSSSKPADVEDPAVEDAIDEEVAEGVEDAEEGVEAEEDAADEEEEAAGDDAEADDAADDAAADEAPAN